MKMRWREQLAVVVVVCVIAAYNGMVWLVVMIRRALSPERAEQEIRDQLEEMRTQAEEEALPPPQWSPPKVVDLTARRRQRAVGDAGV